MMTGLTAEIEKDDKGSYKKSVRTLMAVCVCRSAAEYGESKV